MSGYEYFYATQSNYGHINIIIEPAIPGGLIRKPVPAKCLDCYYFYRVNGRYFEFFTQTPMIVSKDSYSAYNRYTFEGTDITLDHGWGTKEYIYETDAAYFLKLVEPFMQDGKAKLAMEKHFSQARARCAAKKAEEAKKAADARTAEARAQSTLENWLKR